MIKALLNRLGLPLACGAAAFILSLVLSWPLAQFAGRGIPSSAQNIEQPAWRYAIHGDHLQLLYHFDLMGDMLAGRVPWFQNPFEFNVGQDEDRFRPSAYFFPMSAIYAGFRGLTNNQALSWNLTWMLSVWLSALFMWGWLRGFTKDPIALTLGVLLSLLLPFRWISIFGGSPAGMALLWVPLIAWGIDRAIRQPSLWAGAWVGFAALFCYWGDLQVFYVTMLSLPVLVGISLGYAIATREPLPWRRWPRVLPFGLVSLGVMVSYYLWRKEYLAGSMMGGGRSWHEVRLFSPARDAFFRLGQGVDDTVYIGVFVIIALVLSFGWMALAAWRGRWTERGTTVLFVAVALVAVVTLALALGANGPRRGWFIRQARDVVPYYDMMRQPFKIYALMPLWLGWLLAVGWGSALLRAGRIRNIALLSALILGLGMVWDINRSLSATIALLPRAQDAYATVQAHAQEQGDDTPRALVVPLWPGESADTSLPIFFAHKYQIRLVNGYSPVVSADYFENVFRRLESVNQGWLNDEQLDFLLERGVRYLLLHENQFPERVSPFPVGSTHDRLRAHPRMTPLAQDGAVSAFLLHAEPQDDGRIKRQTRERFPTRRWNFDRMTSAGERVEEPGTHGGAFLKQTPDDDSAIAGPWRVAPSPGLHWLLRVRGQASIEINTLWADQRLDPVTVDVDESDWTWIRVPLPALPEFGQIRFVMNTLDGLIEADTGLLLWGDWPLIEPGQTTRVVPAANFFRAGYSDPDTQFVNLRPDYEPADGIIYGPILPLEAGHYRVEWTFEYDASPGTVLGELAWLNVATRERWTVPVRAGEPALLEWEQTDEHILNWTFFYNRKVPLTLQHVALSRMTDEDSAE